MRRSDPLSETAIKHKKLRGGPLRWQKRSGVATGDVHDLYQRDRLLISVMRLKGGWVWTGLQRHTAHRPVGTLAEAKKDAEAHCRLVLAAADRAEIRHGR